MINPEDVPTVAEILDEFGIADMLTESDYSLLRDMLNERETVLKIDAVQHVSDKLREKEAL